MCSMLCQGTSKKDWKRAVRLLDEALIALRSCSAHDTSIPDAGTNNGAAEGLQPTTVAGGIDYETLAAQCHLNRANAMGRLVSSVIAQQYHWLAAVSLRRSSAARRSRPVLTS